MIRKGSSGRRKKSPSSFKSTVKDIIKSPLDLLSRRERTQQSHKPDEREMKKLYGQIPSVLTMELRKPKYRLHPIMQDRKFLDNTNIINPTFKYDPHTKLSREDVGYIISILTQHPERKGNGSWKYEPILRELNEKHEEMNSLQEMSFHQFFSPDVRPIDTVSESPPSEDETSTIQRQPMTRSDSKPAPISTDKKMSKAEMKKTGEALKKSGNEGTGNVLIQVSEAMSDGDKLSIQDVDKIVKSM